MTPCRSDMVNQKYPAGHGPLLPATFMSMIVQLISYRLNGFELQRRPHSRKLPIAGLQHIMKLLRTAYDRITP